MRTASKIRFERPIDRLQRHLGAGTARGVGTDLGAIKDHLDRTAFMLGGEPGQRIIDSDTRAQAFDAIAHAVATASAHLAATGDVAKADAVLKAVEHLARVVDGGKRTSFPENGLRASIAAALHQRLIAEGVKLGHSDPERTHVFASLPDLGLEFVVADGASSPVLWSEGLHSIAGPGEEWRSLGTAPTLDALVRRVVDVAKAGGKIYVDGVGTYRLDGERFVRVPPPPAPSLMDRPRAFVNQLLGSVGIPV